MPTPRNSETLCHLCAAHRVDGATTDALQNAVADWLIDFDQARRREPITVRNVHDLLMPAAADLLALIARTAKTIPRQDQDPPF